MKILTIVGANLCIYMGIAGLTATDNLVVTGVAMAIGSYITTKLIWW